MGIVASYLIFCEFVYIFLLMYNKIIIFLKNNNKFPKLSPKLIDNLGLKFMI